MPASTYTINNTLNAILRGVAMPVPTGVYVSLHTADPGRTGANEISTTAWPAYARAQASQGGAVGTGFAAPVNRESKNAKQMIYPVHNGAGSITVTHWALYDSATGGNPLVYGTLTSSRTIQPGDVFVVDTAKLSVTVD